MSFISLKRLSVYSQSIPKYTKKRDTKLRFWAKNEGFGAIELPYKQGVRGSNPLGKI